MAEIQEKRFVVNAERYLIFVESTFFEQGVLGENELLDTPRKKLVQNKGANSSAQLVIVFNVEQLDVVKSPMRRASTTGQSK